MKLDALGIQSCVLIEGREVYFKIEKNCSINCSTVFSFCLWCVF